jgi:hypothetical protein
VMEPEKISIIIIFNHIFNTTTQTMTGVRGSPPSLTKTALMRRYESAALGLSLWLSLTMLVNTPAHNTHTTSPPPYISINSINSMGSGHTPLRSWNTPSALNLSMLARSWLLAVTVPSKVSGAGCRLVKICTASIAKEKMSDANTA